MNLRNGFNVFIIKLAVILSGIILEFAGVIMVVMDIKSDGSIFIKTPLIEGSLNATYIGLFVIFMGVMLQVVAIMSKYKYKLQAEPEEKQYLTDKDGKKEMYIFRGGGGSEEGEEEE